MSRYKYAGPYHMIEVEGHKVNLGDEVDLVDDAFVDDQTARGYHIFVRVDSSSTPSISSAEPPPAEEPEAPAPADEPAQ